MTLFAFALELRRAELIGGHDEVVRVDRLAVEDTQKIHRLQTELMRVTADALREEAA